MEKFQIEVRIFDNVTIEKLLVEPQRIDNDTVFKIDYEGTKLATLAVDHGGYGWFVIEGSLDDDSVDEIGSEIESYYE
jgi:hypothetical protein